MPKIPKKNASETLSTIENCPINNFQLWSFPWSMKWTHKKAAELTWLMRWNALPTGKRLSLYNGNNNEVGYCDSCPNTWQNHAHLFFKCPVSQEVWNFYF